MDLFHSLILGLVEGITEFLPISSTGHLILVSQILGIDHSDFLKSFEIIIQLGAILAVVVLYWESLLKIENLKKIIIAFIPTGIIGLLLYKFIKTYLVGNQDVVLWALFLGGLALIIFEIWYEKSKAGKMADKMKSKTDPSIQASDQISSISYKQSLWIGLCQSIAIIPGVSRSAATIVGGLLAGLDRKLIVEFSFLLAVPTMLAASGLDLWKNADSFSVDQFGALVMGLIVSFITAILSIRFLLGFIKKHDFITFGVYRILLAMVFWLWIF